MTFAELIAKINEFIITNGNNEITAAVLNPILKDIAQWAKDTTGDLEDLTTDTQENLVAAINELNEALQSINNGGVQIYQGTDNPNITPPLTFSTGDFYLQVDGSNIPIQLYQYNGFEWVASSDQDNIDIRKYFYFSPTSTQEEILGYINAITSPIESLEYPTYTVNEKQSVWFIGRTTNYPIKMIKYKLMNKGKGVYGNVGGVGAQGTPILMEDLELMYEGYGYLTDIENDPNTVVIEYGDLEDMTVSEFLNLQNPAIEIQPQDEGYTLFKGTIDGEQKDYLFIGESGLYGVGELQSTEEDFQLLDDGVPEPSVPSLNDTLQVSPNANIPIDFKGVPAQFYSGDVLKGGVIAQEDRVLFYSNTEHVQIGSGTDKNVYLSPGGDGLTETTRPIKVIDELNEISTSNIGSGRLIENDEFTSIERFESPIAAIEYLFRAMAEDQVVAFLSDLASFNLQQVTDNGNTTTGDIKVFNYYTKNGDNEFLFAGEDGKLYSNETLQVIGVNGNGVFNSGTLTDTRNYTLPNASGTLVLKENAVRTIHCDTVDSTPVAGTTSEFLVAAYKIDANDIGVGILDVAIKMAKTGTGGTIMFRIYKNTANSMNGSQVQIGTATIGSTQLYYTFNREFAIKGDGNLYGYPFAVGAVADAGVTLAQSSTSYDTAVDEYILLTMQPTNTGDTGYITRFKTTFTKQQ